MRQLLLPALPDERGEILLSGSDYHYLIQVLRLREGSLVEARCVDGTLLFFKISLIRRKARELTLQVTAQEKRAIPATAGANQGSLADIPPEFPRLVLLQWILKGSRMDQVVRQATETGVAVIIPVSGERSLAREPDAVGGGKSSRWERVVREARQQSGSPVSTKITNPMTLEAAVAYWQTLVEDQNATALVLTEAPLARKTLHEYLVSNSGAVALAVGPEGGMSEQEIRTLETAGFSPLHFRTNILRAETAALYGIAAIQMALTERETWLLKESDF